MAKKKRDGVLNARASMDHILRSVPLNLPQTLRIIEDTLGIVSPFEGHHIVFVEEAAVPLESFATLSLIRYDRVDGTAREGHLHARQSGFEIQSSCLLLACRALPQHGRNAFGRRY